MGVGMTLDDLTYGAILARGTRLNLEREKNPKYLLRLLWPDVYYVLNNT